MPKQKINNSLCSVKNCDKDSNIFQCLTQLAMKKAIANSTIQQYLYLQLVIIENKPINKDKPISNLPNKLSLGDQIKKMMAVLYKIRQESLVLDSKEFNEIIENADSGLKCFFPEICNILILNNHLPYNQDEDKKINSCNLVFDG
ncbi:19193_t:CDS:2 [Cetraspora pellucida]|uniref:19193_t:CDS:1 n=1 Tax=Cetraspora pellucida TaxID=1433469 RepID=A0A9N9EXA0_9GLOM|nr:19193_t:CDS:2 [Cetraspora pellucida]